MRAENGWARPGVGGQRRPIESRSREAVAALLSTAELVRRRLSAAVEPFGITPQQYNVLRVLGASEPEGLPTLGIAERLIEQTPGITRLLDRLEARGRVRRERAKEDRRRVICRITPAGLDLLAAMDEPMDEADDLAMAMLSDQGKERLIDLLDHVRAGCGG